MALRTPILTTQVTPPDLGKPRVWNKHHKNAPADAVYIGRGGRWGNPYTVEKYGREEAIRRYEEAINAHPDYRAIIKRELKGKHLLCFCSPAHCHGDVLLRIANEE